MQHRFALSPGIVRYEVMFFNTVVQTLREQHGLHVYNPRVLRRSIGRTKALRMSSRDCADAIAQRPRHVCGLRLQGIVRPPLIPFSEKPRLVRGFFVVRNLPV